MTTLRCKVGSKPSKWSTYLDWNHYHRWPRRYDGNSDRATGRCLNCGLTLAEASTNKATVLRFPSRVLPSVRQAAPAQVIKLQRRRAA